MNSYIAPKIVVITPVKNEDWILERFLSVSSHFADHIIIADQNSTDRSREICEKYSKVTLISNPSGNYDEAERQLLLIRTARELVPGPRVLLALDADEILAADAVYQPGWQKMLKEKPGTVLCFEKPDLFLSTRNCIRYQKPWPLGYVDDGVEHKPKKIHSIRIPEPEHASILHIEDVKIMHYGLACMDRQEAKMRLYSVLENSLGTLPSVLRRRNAYPHNKRYSSDAQVTSCPDIWFTAWEELGVDMHSLPSHKYYWQDYQVLKEFHKHGEKHFWADNIWNVDWEECRLNAIGLGICDIPNRPIRHPKRLFSFALRVGDAAFSVTKAIKRSLWHST